MKKIYGSFQIHEIFYFGLKVHFVYFSVHELEKKEESYQERQKREKIICCHDTDNKNSQTWCQ
jgi:hypothetical protein